MADKRAYSREVGREAARNGGRRDKAIRTVDAKAKKAAKRGKR